MSYYIIKSGSIQDIKTARKIISKMPDDLKLQYFLLECDDIGNVIKEVSVLDHEDKSDFFSSYWIRKREKERWLIVWRYYNERKVKAREIGGGE